MALEMMMFKYNMPFYQVGDTLCRVSMLYAPPVEPITFHPCAHVKIFFCILILLLLFIVLLGLHHTIQMSFSVLVVDCNKLGLYTRGYKIKYYNNIVIMLLFDNYISIIIGNIDIYSCSSLECNIAMLTM